MAKTMNETSTQKGSRSLTSTSNLQQAVPEILSNLPFDWKQAAGVLVGAWFLRRFPKTALVGIFSAGIVAGMAMANGKKSFFSSDEAKDLH